MSAGLSSSLPPDSDIRIDLLTSCRLFDLHRDSMVSIHCWRISFAYVMIPTIAKIQYKIHMYGPKSNSQFLDCCCCRGRAYLRECLYMSMLQRVLCWLNPEHHFWPCFIIVCSIQESITVKKYFVWMFVLWFILYIRNCAMESVIMCFTCHRYIICVCNGPMLIASRPSITCTLATYHQRC